MGKWGIFNSGNLQNGESLKAGIFKMENLWTQKSAGFKIATGTEELEFYRKYYAFDFPTEVKFVAMLWWTFGIRQQSS